MKHVQNIFEGSDYFMEINKKDYPKFAMDSSPKSPLWKDMAKAFLFGGAICTIGQLITQIFLASGVSEKDSKTWTSVVLVFLGVLLTALRLYDKMAKHAGAGTIVPITGFANSVAAPAIEFKTEGHVLGLGAKIFTIAGPVILFSTTASIVYGLIVWFFKLY